MGQTVQFQVINPRKWPFILDKPAKPSHDLKDLEEEIAIKSQNVEVMTVQFEVINRRQLVTLYPWLCTP